MLISIASSIFSGTISFIGVIISVGGAIFILKQQIYADRNIEKDKKEYEISVQLESLELLLESTIRDTDVMVNELTQIYINFYKENILYGDDVLELKQIEILDKGLSFGYMINELGESPFDKDKRYINLLSKYNIEDIKKHSYIYEKQYSDLYVKIYEAFHQGNDFKSLVYDKNWCTYILNIGINEKKYEDKVDRVNISKWLCTLDSSVIESNLSKLNNMSDETLKMKIRFEIHRYIADFLIYRDEILNILAYRFDNEMEGAFSSTEYFQQNLSWSR